MGDFVNRLAVAREFGQSVWLDQISREMLASGALEDLVRDGVAGVTTNPSIFEAAVAKGSAYDAEIAVLAAQGRTAPEILDRLMVADVQAACDVFRPLYEGTDGRDGYVSIEVPPALAYDTQATIAEARRIWDAVGRPNVMIKIPGTKEGMPAVRASLADGLNVNVTLLFSLAQYEGVVEAYFSGLEDRLATGRGLNRVASVASFFSPRVDTLGDKAFAVRLAAGVFDAGRLALVDLKGTLAVANCKLVYERFRGLFAADRWRRLADNGAGVQRVLWASTSTKNPAYADLLYVDTLIGPQTVNTLPAATLEAFRDHGVARPTVEEGMDAARAAFAATAAHGIDMGALTEKLQVDGVAAFQKSFEGLLAIVEEKRARPAGA